MTAGFGFCATCGTPRGAVDQLFCAGCGSAFSPAAPPPVGPPPTPSPAPSYPPAYPSAHARKGGGFKILGRLVMVLGILLVVVLVAVSYLGVAQVPGLSSAFGMDHPRDLHMVRDSAALNEFLQKWGIERPSPAQDYVLLNKHHYSGSVQIDDTISEAALAAAPEFNTPNAHVTQIQFRIHEGSMEMSAFVNVPGYPVSGPMYAQFSMSVPNSREVSVDFSHLEFGRIGVPSSVIDNVKTAVNDFLNEKILEAGVTIDTLELHEGAVRFKGTWPKTITVDPLAGVP